MRYFLAVVCPPLAVLMCGKPGQCVLNLLLCLCVLVPGIIHALCVVASAEADAHPQAYSRNCETIESEVYHAEPIPHPQKLFLPVLWGRVRN